MRGRGHIFEDLDKLNQMLALRSLGHSASDLANHYGCDHSTIIYHCKRAGLSFKGKKTTMVVASGILAVAGMLPVIKKKPKIKIVMNEVRPTVVRDFDGTLINMGKLTYAEYLEEEERKMKKKQELLWERLLNNNE